MISLLQLPADLVTSLCAGDAADRSRADEAPRGAMRTIQAVMLTSLVAVLLLVLFAPAPAHAQPNVVEQPRRLSDRIEHVDASEYPAQAPEGLSLSLYRKRPGLKLGKVRYEAAWKAQVGQGPRLAGALGSWSGELQLIRSSSRGVQPYGSNYRRGLWTLNGSSLALTPHEGTTLFAYSKVGLHYLSKASEEGQQDGLSVGLGAGLAWQLPSRAQFSVELSRIGSRGSNVLSLGTQIPF